MLGRCERRLPFAVTERYSPSVDGFGIGLRILWVSLLLCVVSPLAGAAPCANLKRDFLPPDARQQWEQQLIEAPARERTACALWLIDAEGPLTRRSLPARLSGLRILEAHPMPEAAGELFVIFARARMGDLPEDPDLFERALRILQRLEPPAIRSGLETGLAPGLLDLSHERLMCSTPRP